MTSINGVGASGMQQSVYGTGGISAPGGASEGGGSILEHDNLPKEVENYVQAAQREFLQRRGDLQRHLAQTDDPEKQQQLQEELDQLDRSFEAFRKEVAAGLRASGADQVVPGPRSGDGLQAGGEVGPGPQNGDGVRGAGSSDEAGSLPGNTDIGETTISGISSAASELARELQGGFDAHQPQKIDPPPPSSGTSDVGTATFVEARDNLAESDLQNPDLSGEDRAKLDDMLELMESLSPRDTSEHHRREIRG